MPQPVLPELRVSLQPKQRQLYNAIVDRRPEAPTILGYGGSRGAAKSGGVRRIALALASEAPCIIWIIRRIWDDLNKDHVKPLFAEYPALKDYWRAGDKELQLPNGSSIFFIHSGNEGRAKRKARGPQAHYIFLEQAEEFSGEEMENLAGSNRAPGVAPGYCKRIYTFNPGGIGTSYLRRIFNLRDFHDNENAADFMFIQAYGWDNYEWFRGAPGIVSEKEFYRSREWTEVETFEYFGCQVTTSRKAFETFIKLTDFGKKLAALPQSERIGELMGSFEKFTGQYYAEVWEESATVLPVDVVVRIMQPWWKRWLATDWGFSHWAPTGWFTSGLISPAEVLKYFGVTAAMPVRIVILYREAVPDEQLGEPDLAKLIVALTPEAERREIRHHFGGHDMWAKKGSANTIAEQMDAELKRGGLKPLEKADIDRVGGWRLMYNCWASARRLRNWPKDQTFTQRPEDMPAFFVSAACTETIAAIPMLICDDDNPTDVKKLPGHIEDDVADMCFTADTLIECEFGRIPIADVKPGMCVWTRDGLRAVRHAWKSRGWKRIVRAAFTDGSALRLTPHHRIWSDSEGRFIPLREMRYGDKICTWSQLFKKRKLVNPSLPNCVRAGSINSLAKTAGILRLRRIIQTTKNLLKSYGYAVRVIARRMVPCRNMNAFARPVALSTWELKGDSVQTPASLSGEGMRSWTTPFTCAVFARSFSSLIVTIKSLLARSNAVRLYGYSEAGLEDVYDLEVDGTPEFFANGILVHNCRYGLKSYLTARRDIPDDIVAAETYQKYQDPTDRAMAMLRLSAAREKTQHLMRRRRL